MTQMKPRWTKDRDLPALLLTELDGLSDEVFVVGELGSGEAGR
jgi:hypothetical protein